MGNAEGGYNRLEFQGIVKKGDNAWGGGIGIEDKGSAAYKPSRPKRNAKAMLHPV
jgi:hypothetical protein